MKKIHKIILIVACALVLVGAVVIGGAFVAAGFEWNKFTIDDSDLTEYTADIDGEGITELITANNYDRYDVVLTPSADKDFHITYVSRDKDDISFKTANGALTVASKSGEWQDYVGFFDYNRTAVTIAVPATVENADLRMGAMNLDCSKLIFPGSLTIYADAGDITLTDLQTKDLSLKADIANVEMRSVTCENLNIELDCADVDLQQVSAEKLIADVDMGSLHFSSLLIGKSLDLSADAGSIDGTIDDSMQSFTVNTSTDVGTCNLPPHSDGGEKILNADVEAGELYITFLK